MNRQPPGSVKKILRQEVNFVCPIPDCGNPILTWHHFDPPWKKKHHHDPNGMIALCTQHHPLADGENWTKEYLHNCKKNPPRIERIQKKFCWSEKSVIYRLGGNYAAHCSYIITINKSPILWHSQSPDGRLLFSLVLHDKDDNKIFCIEENMLEFNPLIYDFSINTYENYFKVWMTKLKIGLEIRLSHLTIREFETLVNKDANHTEKIMKKIWPKEFHHNLAKPDTSCIINYANDNCLNSDNKIVVFNILNANLYYNGKHVNIKNGIAPSNANFCFSYNNRGAFGF